MAKKLNVTQLIFECGVCKRMYDEPGMCKQCDFILKPKAS